ncbi:MAG: ribosomal RNA small subunit methyltransferase A [Opitutales bacterium]|jgi:16S rRNA (adenine1518-N6/adenine1519-N6)-dimethyltransferase|nr:ribosomal RNA small subunit methyltransferase A [Opitutales bacterium]MBT5167066.1 ribosomal RNA small subunit methyltransferase A [Opitutales bacterium]MBT5814328.1 ribosomal RNA small subunit methyltransferase A [Opitutales bacterium]MDG2254445.1 16S rRNA (adenine(1518)-N(6)/adenine(1519)-N(6))-dimethyltransferase RsmA [Opitutaceae bacterium]
MSSPLSPSETRALLERIEHRPIRKLGQNFLIDGNIVRKSLELAKIQTGDTVIEIGPGLGTLTRALLNAGATVYAIEKDKRLAAHILSMEAEFENRLHLLEGDAMDEPRAGLPENSDPFKIVANLPYAISTPWMEAIINGPAPQSMTLMLQKEAAQRFVAQSGSKQLGAISIFLQAAFETPTSHDVAASCFYPKPDVGSRLLNLEAKPTPFYFTKEDRILIRDLFNQRRKQISSLLKKHPAPRAALWLTQLDLLNIDLQSRPEQIALEIWIQLGQT